MRYKQLFFGAIGLSLVCIALYGQNPKITLDWIGVEDGLPEELVIHLEQDDLGYIWMGTQNGLVKFDGYTLHRFQPRSQKSNLAMRSIGYIKQGDSGKIWLSSFSSYNGLVSYDPTTGNFTYFPDTTRDEYGKFAYSILAEDSEGYVWLTRGRRTIPGSEILKLDPHTGSYTDYNLPVRNRFINDILSNRAFAQSVGDQSVWVLSQGSIYQKPAKKDSFSLIYQKGNILPGMQRQDALTSLKPMKNGHLLLNSETAVFLWDPQKKQIYQHFDLVPESAKDSKRITVKGAFQVDATTLFVPFEGGDLSVIDTETGKIDHLIWGNPPLDFPGLPDRIREIMPKAFAMDGLWLEIRHPQAQSYLFYDFKTRSFTYFDQYFNDPLNRRVPSFTANNLLVDKTGQLWLGSRPGLYRQSSRKRRFDYFSRATAPHPSWPSDTINGLHVDRRNWLWISTPNGLVRFKPETESFDVFRHNAANPASIPHNQAVSIQEDSQGRLWITFQNGFARWLPERDAFQRYFYDPDRPGFLNNPVIKLVDHPSGAYYVVTFNRGIYAFDPKTGTITPKFGEAHGLTAPLTWFFIDSQGGWWAGNRYASEPGVFYRAKDSLTFKAYSTSLGDSTSLSSNEVHFIHEDPYHNIWIGTEQGLNLYNRAKDSFTRFFVNDPISVDSYLESAQKELYFTTYSGDGLIQMDPETKSYKFISEDQGLLHSDISFTLGVNYAEDHFGHLYLPTRRGLSVFNPQTESFTNFTAHEGFFTKPFFSMAVDSSGLVWIGGNKGLHRIDPVELMRKDSTLPSLVLTGLQVNDLHYADPDSTLLTKHISYTDAITLSHRQKNITFEFVALHYLRPEDNQYSWKLENYDTDWSEPTLERKANYTNLSPGTYTFRVKGSNADGIWNEEGTSLQITILPPWWATTWAYLVYALLIVAVIWGIVQWRTRFLRKQRQNLQTKVAEQTQELRLRNADLRKAKEEALAAEASAREANETKSNFLSTVSHELRTPLTSVLGFTRIVRKRFTEKIVPALPANDKTINRAVTQIEKNLDVVVKEGDRLTNLINDVLDLAKIESGRTEWRMEALNINTVIQHAHHATASLFDGKGIAYRERLADNLPTIQGDQDKLIQVLVNLFSNAVKFTDEGSVTVSSSLENEQVVVRVQDTGIGIAAEDMPKVFEKFRQVGDTLTDKPQGTGLGLPICQEIIQHLGGDIWVDSTPGVGSTFGFALPTAKALASKGSHDKLDALLQELRRKIPVSEKFNPHESHQNILVVDDEAGIRELLRQELSDLGYQVTLAEDGQKALQSIRQKRPDMIILDVMMPELNGFDVAAILKNDPKTVDIPILILSIVQDQVRGYKIGVDRYLHKPIDMDRLSWEVASLMNGGKSTKKILVVDEQDSAAKTISKALIAQGYQVIEADTQRLLEMAKSNQPDAIILNASLENQEAIVKALRFEKGLDSVLFLMYQ